MEEQAKKHEVKHTHSEEKQEGKECVHCHVANESESQFCAECGHDFREDRKCPNCGAKVSANADICEACGTWLLDRICKFCNAEIEEGATFCAECGNPISGIICPQCGKLSCFDFCKDCCVPLTSAAQNAIKEIQIDKSQVGKEIKFSSNQEARRFFMAQKYVQTSNSTESSTNNPPGDLCKLKEYVEKSKKNSVKPPISLFSSKQKESIGELGKTSDAEMNRREEERKRQEELKREQEREAIRQEELRIRKEEEERKRQKGWHCNFVGVFHKDGPCGCGDPAQGGHWETYDEYMECTEH